MGYPQPDPTAPPRTRRSRAPRGGHEGEAEKGEGKNNVANPEYERNEMMFEIEGNQQTKLEPKRLVRLRNIQNAKGVGDVA